MPPAGGGRCSSVSLRAYALFVDHPWGRLLAALRMRNWSRAAVTFMASATIEYGVLFYLGADFIDLRSWHIEGLSSLMEPIIAVVLGIPIGGMVISMYLLIFPLGAVV